MTAYTATFSDGHTLALKNSTREYGFAYRWYGTTAEGNLRGSHGFARTRELAQKALDRDTACVRVAPKMPRRVTVHVLQYMRKLIAAWRPGTIEFAEIVPVARTGKEG